MGSSVETAGGEHKMTVLGIAAVSGVVLIISVFFGMLVFQIIRSLYDHPVVMWGMILVLMWALVFLSLCVKAYTKGGLL